MEGDSELDDALQIATTTTFPLNLSLLLLSTTRCDTGFIDDHNDSTSFTDFVISLPTLIVRAQHFCT